MVPSAIVGGGGTSNVLAISIGCLIIIIWFVVWSWHKGAGRHDEEMQRNQNTLWPDSATRCPVCMGGIIGPNEQLCGDCLRRLGDLP
jgi:hypothetical protein